MRTFGLYANFRISGSIARRVRHFLAGLLHVVPYLRRFVLVRQVPGTVWFLRRFVYIQDSCFFVVPFKWDNDLRRFGSGREIIYDRYTSTFNGGVQIKSAVLVTSVRRYEGQIVRVFLGEVIRTTFTIKQPNSIMVGSRSTTSVRGFRFRPRDVGLSVGL